MREVTPPHAGEQQMEELILDHCRQAIDLLFTQNQNPALLAFDRDQIKAAEHHLLTIQAGLYVLISKRKPLTAAEHSALSLPHL